MKFLIVGLGNIGEEYENTRHNIGFQILDELLRAEYENASGKTGKTVKTKKLFSFLKSGKPKFKSGRLASVASVRIKNHDVCLIKPSTYVNRSGDAVRYWLQKEKIPLGNLLVVADDINLPFGTLRLRANGSDGGHNGLKDIITILETTDFSRLRFGIGSDFPKGQQVDYVLGKWSDDQVKDLPGKISFASEAIRTFVVEGVQKAMTKHNR